MQSMYDDILEDVSKGDAIIEETDRIYRTDDAQIYSGFANTSDIFNVKTKDPEKWLLPSESTVRITWQLTNAAETAAQVDGSIAATPGVDMATLIAGGLHLFDRIRLIIDDNVCETVEKPGFCHLVEHLLTTNIGQLKSAAENEWLYLDDGSWATGTFTESGNSATQQAFILGPAATGAAARVNSHYGLADAVQYLGTSNVGANMGGYNPRYNSGFAARWKRSHPYVGAGPIDVAHDIELAFPASRLVGFFADIKSAFRGVQFELEFTKNINYTEIIHGKAASSYGGNAINAADLAHVVIKKIDWVMPTVIPNTLVLEKVQRQLQSGDRVRKAFHSTTAYVGDFVASGAGDYDIDWRVQSTGKKIVRVVIGFQRADQYSQQNDPDADTPPTTANHANGGVFTTFNNISALELRFGSVILPKERYQRLSFSDAAPDFSRVYVDFCNAGGKWIDDDGNLVSYEKFQKLYPLFAFDLSQMDLTKANTTSEDLRVVATVNGVPQEVAAGNARRFRIIALVSYEYPLDMYGVDGRLAIELP